MRLVHLVVVSAVISTFAACAQPSQAPAPQATAAPAMSQTERGKYLTIIAGCNDCHTPTKVGPNGPEPDMSRELSGHPATVAVKPAAKVPDGWMGMVGPTFTAWQGPWGVSFTANLTPDQNTGTGVWTEEMFIKTIREGKHMGNGRPILPPMPWPMYRHMTDDDLKAIFAYLRTITPISNRVPDPIPPAGAQ